MLTVTHQLNFFQTLILKNLILFGNFVHFPANGWDLRKRREHKILDIFAISSLLDWICTTIYYLNFSGKGKQKDSSCLCQDYGSLASWSKVEVFERELVMLLLILITWSCCLCGWSWSRSWSVRAWLEMKSQTKAFAARPTVKPICSKPHVLCQSWDIATSMNLVYPSSLRVLSS
jgi:hypothetical protein